MIDYIEIEVENIYEEVKELRHHLHKHPETSFNEFKTAKYIVNYLSQFKELKVRQLTNTSVVADLNVSNTNAAQILLRADIDALKMQEDNDLSYKSVNDNVMHACGHDMHTAALLGTIKILVNNIAKINNNIRFIFQHAEETPPGGAIELIEKEVLKNADYIFALHVFPEYPTGVVALKKGVMFASSDTFKVTIDGKGAHAAQPNCAKDPVTIAALMILNMQTIVSRRTNPLYSPIISTTMINGGSAVNVIPSQVIMQGSIRNLDNTTREETKQLFYETLKGIADANQVSVTIEYNMGYPIGINNDECYHISKNAASKFLKPQDIIELDYPLMGSEDFNYYLRKVKGNFAIIGMGNDINKNTNLHNSNMVSDDNALKIAMKLHLYTVMELNDINNNISNKREL
ncbi:M20 metallopeptidase family protein [Mycoplasma sp. P36-A1]|uniref:M20 metallopeptidase family protein n=1 Tax=Mycoplasma sp. P36-A1 TaxID=3252900 RepID=UPI003C3060F9